MNLVPFTVMVPEHHAELMSAIGRTLTDFERLWAMSYVDQVLQDHDDPGCEFGHAVELAVGGYIFDTKAEEEEARRLVREACKTFATAEARYQEERKAA